MTTDDELVRIAAAPAPATIDEVIMRLERIDSVLPNNDGLRWFNLLYLIVTKQVKDHPPVGGWNDPRWITGLDVVFAALYLASIAAALGPTGTTPKSWQALFEARHQTGIDRIQFALAGMNAHINHDLALALLQTDAEFHLTPNLTSPEHADFEHVNGLLEAAVPEAMQTLATGIVGEVAQSTGRIGRLLAIWNVRVARDLAWDFGDHLRGLGRTPRSVALSVQDKITGALGRSLLLVV